MKKVKLVLALLLTLALLAAVILAARLVLGMMSGLRQAGMDVVEAADTEGETPPAWSAPTDRPYSLSDMAYEASEPRDPMFTPSPAPPEEMVTVPVLETAEQLAEEQQTEISD